MIEGGRDQVGGEQAGVEELLGGRPLIGWRQTQMDQVQQGLHDSCDSFMTA